MVYLLDKGKRQSPYKQMRELTVEVTLSAWWGQLCQRSRGGASRKSGVLGDGVLFQFPTPSNAGVMTDTGAI